MQPNIAILAGEVSGDRIGGALAHALCDMRSDLLLWGCGACCMAEAGVNLIYDSARWGAIGVVEALKVYPELRFKVYPHVLREIERRRPAVIVLIDFGAFNVKVARECKKRSVPVLYYMPPGSWKRLGRLNPEIARITDCIAAPFPWSAERLKEIGANVTFVGHPLLELARPTMTRAQFADRFGMEPGHPIIGLLPGSRGFEVEYNTPVLLGAARLIHRELSNGQFVFGLASETARQKVENALLAHRDAIFGIEEQSRRRASKESEIDRQLADLGPRMVTPEGVEVRADLIQQQHARRKFTERLKEPFEMPPVVLTQGLTYDVMAHSDVLLVCSGSATLEAAILGTPMVILYRGSKLMEMEAKLRRIRPEHIGMPNIIAGKRIVPEFIQNEATPQALADSAMRFLREPDTRARVKAELAKVRETLGTPGASARTARIALELAGLLTA